MRSVTLNLRVLISGFNNDQPWPGSEETINLNDEACPPINGDKPIFKVEQGFVVFEGESLQGQVDESQASGLETGWTYYTQEDAAALINGWALAGFEWHAATKIYCSNNPSVFWVVSDTVFDVSAAINVCCGAPSIANGAFVFKISNRPLTPGVDYLCPVSASYKWLAVRNPDDIRNLEYKFLMELTTDDEVTTLTNNADPAVTLSSTVQVVRNWPADFVGLVLDGITLIADGETPGVNEINVGDFDLGNIKMTTVITDTDTLETISTMEETWAIPASCGIFEDSFSPEFE